ncbi:TorF family putative porin [Alkalilimnicola sp. S0819]|uniref:TorF family putative porin n=1 Tax=Alkalilimnicola sp. S0819 TaxID=2613922 RepID=UPI001261BA20|nr:TorF family putative porin [Alkalilimnicola sp. S0819]KAB7623946.1 hypothetical protein F3N43_07830 [Alkalilimnicola sp. S0819]MPQ16545.1 hypothetical protein [Alkalilimnicola sp. S0819]
MSFTRKTTTTASVCALLAGTVALPAQAELSGNIGVVSEYVFRGITNAPENDDAAVQGGLDWAHDSGFYLGYWGSSLGYSDESGGGFESDFYGGHAGSLGMFSYDVGLIYYHYTNIDDADVPEFAASLGLGPVSLGVNVLLDDVVWGNEGDAYWTLGFAYDLPKDFSFAATAGFYTYEDSGEFIASSAESSGFRHLDLSLSRPIGDTGAEMRLTYIVGGEDRDGVEQDDAVVLGLSYNFDI